jgi:menaquinone-dependent protoporphyrinogen oxidase
VDEDEKMSTLIAFSTRHGCTEDAAQMLAEHLNGDVTFVNLKKNGKPDLSEYETVIIGGSIHVGKIQSHVRKFIEKNMEVLLEKRTGLYVCCMEEERAQEQFDNAYPVELRKNAAALGIFGGAFNFERMNFLERKIVQKVANTSQSVFKIDKEEIKRFGEKMARNETI